MQASKIDVKFGYSCNNNCIHCVIAGHVERLRKEGLAIDRTTGEIKDILTNAKNEGISSVVFTGGEVTIRGDFFELLEFAKGLGFSVSLQTNGRTFSIRKFSEKTLSIAPDMHFEVAVHSDKRQTHDGITGASGSFDQTIKGIKNLKDMGAVSVNVKVVISKLNFKDMQGIVLIAKDLGVKQVDIAFPHGMGNALKYYKEVIPRYNDIRQYILDTIEIGNQNGVNITYEAIPFCLLVGYEKHASELQYLNDWLKGETSELRQIGDPVIDWQKNRLSIKCKAEKCGRCRYFNICEGVWREYADLFGMSELKPVEGSPVDTLEKVNSLLKVSSK